MTKQEAIQEQIDDIMDTFEFDDVHSWMEHSGWVWAQPNGTTAVPDLYEIKRCARQRLKEAAENGYSATGGFVAQSYEGTDKDGPWITLSLHFGLQTYNDGTSYTE